VYTPVVEQPAAAATLRTVSAAAPWVCTMPIAAARIASRWSGVAELGVDGTGAT
jgi:hypothetical protein